MGIGFKTSQEVLKSLDFSVETIINNTDYPGFKIESNKISRVKKIQELSYSELFSKINNKIWNFIHNNKIQQNRLIRIDAFKVFSSSYILETNYTISENNIPSDFSDRFDFFVTGSDQVWNPFLDMIHQLIFWLLHLIIKELHTLQVLEYLKYHLRLLKIIRCG